MARASFHLNISSRGSSGTAARSHLTISSPGLSGTVARSHLIISSQSSIAGAVCSHLSMSRQWSVTVPAYGPTNHIYGHFYLFQADTPYHISEQRPLFGFAHPRTYGPLDEAPLRTRSLTRHINALCLTQGVSSVANWFKPYTRSV